MPTHFLPYAKQSIDEKDIEEVAKALRQDVITRGAFVEAFEEAVSHYCGCSYAVAFNSGTTALIAACHAANVSSNDRFLTTPNTFIATVGAGIHRQASPIFVDIDRSTGNLNLEHLKHNLNQPSSRGRTVVMPVHFAGTPVDMRALDGMINNPETIVIEDAAHAFGSSYKDGQKVGSCRWSQMTMFSFHPAKTITTGEGGMITTNDPDLYHRLKRFRNNGIERDPVFMESEAAPWKYEVHEVTNNYNFTDFQAALGLSQLARVNLFIEHRKALVLRYRERLQDIPHIRLFTDAWDQQTAFHLFVVQIDFSKMKQTRAGVMDALKAKGIGTQVHYIPLYRHPALKKTMGDIEEYFPEMEGYYAEALSLPLYYDLSKEDVDYVVDSLRTCLLEHSE